MEETNQQVVQKPPLPIKTKIAAWWMIIAAAIIIILGIRDLIKPSGIPLLGRLMIMLFMISPFFLSLWGATYLLKRAKGAYTFSVIITIIIIVYSFLNLEEQYIWKLEFLSNILILFFLLLDRKNFFKIASSNRF